MKTDLYTKTILTVIAIALTVNILKDLHFIEPVQANTHMSYLSVPVNPDGTINVNVKSMPTEPTNVNIEKVNEWAFDYVKPILVKIERN